VIKESSTLSNEHQRLVSIGLYRGPIFLLRAADTAASSRSPPNGSWYRAAMARSISRVPEPHGIEHHVIILMV